MILCCTARKDRTFCPDTVTYSTVLNAFANAEKADEFEHCFSESVTEGTADATMYSMPVGAECRAVGFRW